MNGRCRAGGPSGSGHSGINFAVPLGSACDPVGVTLTVHLLVPGSFRSIASQVQVQQKWDAAFTQPQILVLPVIGPG